MDRYKEQVDIPSAPEVLNGDLKYYFWSPWGDISICSGLKPKARERESSAGGNKMRSQPRPSGDISHVTGSNSLGTLHISTETVKRNNFQSISTPVYILN